MGADAVELDVRRTRDGVLVVHHDALVASATIGPTAAAIHETAAAELPGHVPVLGDALDACVGMWVNVEIKNDSSEAAFDAADAIADETVAHLLARHEDDRWLISCFRLETVDRCRSLAPQIRTAWLVDAVPPDAAATCRAHGHAALHPQVALLARHTVEECHRLGVDVNTWTCDDPVRMSELIEWGIDGICTNVPDLAVTTRERARP